MKITVLGGTGFIGEHICRKLSENSRYEIISIYHGNIEENEKIKNVEYIKIDLNKDFDLLKIVLAKTDLLIFSIQPDAERIKKIFEIFPEKKINRILYLSTLLVYPDAKNPQREDVLPVPVTEYEKKKFGEELLLSEYCLEKEIILIIARLANVYGDTKNKGIINLILDSIYRGRPLKINGKGGQIRDYIFVEDAARFIEYLIEAKIKQSKEIFNICTGRGSTIKDIIFRIEEIVGCQVHFKFSNSIVEKKCVIGDNKKIKSISPNMPKYNLTSGLKKTIINYNKKYGKSI
jgi:nucleoside-diphosphate-sugar epimerase